MSVEVVTVQPRARNSGLCCAKIVKHLGRHRNRVQPTRGSTTPGSEFFEVAPGRTLHVLRPELKSQRYYEALAVERPESIADNFYTRWARRPHPSDNCRCSFRQSTTGRLSSPEEALVSRIRTSLCEAERTGRDIDEIERSLGKVDLAKIDIPVESDVVKSETANSRIHPIDDSMKQRIVKDLDKYISELLDEILNDTIKAIAQSENPFGRREAKQQQPSLPDQPCSPTFNITFAFHSDEDKKDKEEKVSEEGKGYDNPGFVESLSDPETMDFHLRRRINGDRMMENADCTDSGINSVETVELQPEQEPNLEQSLMDIIDAKLGGSSIGKSLENLSMEIDAADNADVSTREQPTVEQVQMSSHEKSIAEDEPIDKKSPVTSDAGEASSNEQQAKVESTEPTESKSPVEAVEEPSFTARGLRLEFKQSNRSKESADESKPRPRAVSRFSKTLSLIRRRLVTRLNKRRRKRVSAPETSKSSRLSGGPCKPGQGRSSLRPIDLNRRRIPVPLRLITPELEDEAGVTLRRRGRKPTIVFLHGFGASADSFQPQLRYFADLGYPCVAPDMLGHGLSSAPNRGADYQFDRLLADLEAVLLKYAFRPGQKCVLVGHNYGCSFATALAQRYAANVHQLVLIAGGGPIPLAPPPGREGPGHCCLRSCLTPLLFCGVRRGVMYSARGRQHPYCGPEGIPWASTHLRHVLGGMSWPDGDHVFLRRICTPTLLVHGLRDDKVSLVQECQMERTMGKAVLEAIPTAGHMPMTDCPEQLNHMIHCFIDLWKNKKW